MYGFKCYAENGELLVSSEYLGYHLITGLTYVGTVRIPDISWGLTWYKYSVNLPTSLVPLIFLDFDISDTGVFAGLNKVGNNWEFLVRGTVATNINKIKVFAKYVGATPTGNGIVVKKDTGEVAFSSGNSPLWLTDYAVSGTVTLQSPNFDQITGTLAQPLTNPIYWANIVAGQSFPFSQTVSLVGWKRTDANTWATQNLGTGGATVTVRNISMLIADLVT
jgi:hypothetical protein